MPFGIEVFFAAPVRLPVQIVADGKAVSRQILTQTLGQLLQKTPLIFLGRFDFRTIGQVGDEILAVKVLGENQNIRVGARISTDIVVEIAIADREFKCLGAHAEMRLHPRPKRGLLHDRGTVRFGDILGFNSQLHEREMDPF